MLIVNVACGIIYEDKLDRKRQRKSKDEEKLHSALIRYPSRLINPLEATKLLTGVFCVTNYVNQL